MAVLLPSLNRRGSFLNARETLVFACFRLTSPLVSSSFAKRNWGRELRPVRMLIEIRTPWEVQSNHPLNSQTRPLLRAAGRKDPHLVLTTAEYPGKAQLRGETNQQLLLKPVDEPRLRVQQQPHFAAPVARWLSLLGRVQKGSSTLRGEAKDSLRENEATGADLRRQYRTSLVLSHAEVPESVKGPQVGDGREGDGPVHHEDQVLVRAAGGTAYRALALTSSLLSAGDHGRFLAASRAGSGQDPGPRYRRENSGESLNCRGRHRFHE
jgi:hypothetical protein